MSRELDNEVAEILFGWKQIPFCVINGRRIDGPLMWSPDYGNPEDPNCGANAFGRPNYSTDISAAFQVVEKMREMGYWFCGWQDEGGWCCQFNDNDKGFEFLEDQPTLPEAICRAALLALASKKGDAR